MKSHGTIYTELNGSGKNIGTYYCQQIPGVPFAGQKRDTGLLLVNSSKAPHPNGSVVRYRSDDGRIARARRHVVNSLDGGQPLGMRIIVRRPTSPCPVKVLIHCVSIGETATRGEPGHTSNRVPSFTS